MVTLIVAHDQKGGISKDGIIPWKFEVDRNFFEDATTRIYESDKKNALIVGSNTWKQMKKMKLENRVLIVVSRSMKNSDTLFVQSSPQEALDFASLMDFGHIFICGGKNIYTYFLDRPHLLNQILITRIDFDYKCDNCLSNVVPTSFFHEQTRRVIIDNVKLTFDTYTFEFHKLPKFAEDPYLELLHDLIDSGKWRKTRNGVTSSLFGRTLTYDLSEGFPLMTTKKVFFRGVCEELLFFLRGETQSKSLEEKKINIWKENTKDRDGDMGPMYGFQWIHFGETYTGVNKEYKGLNQIEYCLHLLKTDPSSRRILMSTFNPGQAPEGVLFPCHGIHIQFYVQEEEEGQRRLCCLMTQRSADICCGVPFNIASYALLVHLMCNVLNHSGQGGSPFCPGILLLVFADVHLYQEHEANARRQMLRLPYKFPRLKINRKMKHITDVSFSDLELSKYLHYEPLNFPIVS